MSKCVTMYGENKPSTLFNDTRCELIFFVNPRKIGYAEYNNYLRNNKTYYLALISRYIIVYFISSLYVISPNERNIDLVI